MVAGTVFCAAAFLGAGFSNNFIPFLITQGFLFGAGIALLYVLFAKFQSGLSITHKS
jgi:MFS superfamily sulfate permease-like transporter